MQLADAARNPSLAVALANTLCCAGVGGTRV